MGITFFIESVRRGGRFSIFLYIYFFLFVGEKSKNRNIYSLTVSFNITDLGFLFRSDSVKDIGRDLTFSVINKHFHSLIFHQR